MRIQSCRLFEGLDKRTLFSVLYQIWKTPGCYCEYAYGTAYRDGNHNDIAVKPGIDEIPFCMLMMAQPVQCVSLSMYDMYHTDTNNSSVLVEGHCDIGLVRLIFDSDNDTQALIADKISKWARYPHPAPDFPNPGTAREHASSLRGGRVHSFLSSIIYAQGFRVLKDYVKIAKVDNPRYRPLKAKDYIDRNEDGAMYAYNPATQSFMAYDSFSDTLTLCGIICYR